MFQVAFRLPRAALHLNNHRILEDDNVFLHHQGRSLAAAGGWRRAYHLPTQADAAVAAYRRWLDAFGVNAAAPQSTAAGGEPEPPLRASREHLVERLHAHTMSCRQCEQSRGGGG